MAYGLKFISGKYQGGEVPVPEEGELLIGRATEVDLVLAEDMVSRKHARITCLSGKLSIADLGSTNGTFVNGEKVTATGLKRGDRILIGTAILKITDGATTAGTDRATIKSMMQKLGERAPATATMSGDLTEVPLPDLLQLFATNKKTGILSITGQRRGRLYLHQGQLQYAAILDEPQLRPLKAFCRMVAWNSGAFQLDPYEEGVQFPEVLEGSTESLLIEAMRQCDEMRRITSEIPAPNATLVLCQPMAPKLSRLSASELDTLQLALNDGDVQSIIDKSPGTDHEAVTNIYKLLREGYLKEA